MRLLVSTWNTGGMRFASLQPRISPLFTVLHPCAGVQCEMAQEMCHKLHPQVASVPVNTVVLSGDGAFCFSVVFQTRF